jgi:hypothetical protein
VNFKSPATSKGKKSTGSAKVITVTSDNIPVLQADFMDGKQKLRASYLISSDLDNYARLTGKVHFIGKETKTPGLEALFIYHSPDK